MVWPYGRPLIRGGSATNSWAQRLKECASVALTGSGNSGCWEHGAIKKMHGSVHHSGFRSRLNEAGTVPDFVPDLAAVGGGYGTVSTRTDPYLWMAGAQAMATALVLQADGRRGKGRGVGWSNSDLSPKSESEGEKKALYRAGIILDLMPDLADGASREMERDSVDISGSANISGWMDRRGPAGPRGTLNPTQRARRKRVRRRCQLHRQGMCCSPAAHRDQVKIEGAFAGVKIEEPGPGRRP